MGEAFTSTVTLDGESCNVDATALGFLFAFLVPALAESSGGQQPL